MRIPHYLKNSKSEFPYLEEVQFDRDAVLSTTPEDIRGFLPLVADVLNQNALCVYGNAERLTTDQSMFNSLVKIDGSDHQHRTADSRRD